MINMPISIKQINKQKGTNMVLIIVFTAIFFAMISGVLSLIVYQKKLFKLRSAEESAFQVAEAGIEYYRWHIAHAEKDYTDGTGTNCTAIAPCNRIYKDNDENIIGTFSLEIIPPIIGSTMITIKSTGWLTTNPNQKRSIEIQYEKLPLTRYAILSNNYLSMPVSAVTTGLVHSNKGVRFDGVANNLVTSSLAQDNGDDEHGASPPTEHGVHTHNTTEPRYTTPPPLVAAEPLPPSTLTLRPEIFTAGRSFPVPEVDFNILSNTLSDLLSLAQTNIKCNNPLNTCIVIDDSDKKGWHIQLLGDGTFQYRKVKKDDKCELSGGIKYDTGKIKKYEEENWKIKTLPDDGVIFIKDNVWIDGTINGKRVTIVAAKGPLAQSEGADIWINKDLKYNGTGSAIGLIAQNNISIGLYSEDDLEINAAMIAKNGRIGREKYPDGCSSDDYQKTKITINGSVITNQKYVFKYDSGEGFATQIINYDPNLLTSPPPHFPGEENFSIKKWEEK